MSLKTPESQLEELGLDYQIVYDDEESYPDGWKSDPATKHIAWLYNERGKPVGWWSGTMAFTLDDNPSKVPTDVELTQLSDVLEGLR